MSPGRRDVGEGDVGGDHVARKGGDRRRRGADVEREAELAAEVGEQEVREHLPLGRQEAGRARLAGGHRAHVLRQHPVEEVPGGRALDVERGLAGEVDEPSGAGEGVGRAHVMRFSHPFLAMNRNIARETQTQAPRKIQKP